MSDTTVRLSPGPSTSLDLAVSVDSFAAIRQFAPEYGDVSSRRAASRESETLDPDRFTAQRVAERHPYAYIPFAAGPRRGVSDFFGRVEMQVHFGLMTRHLHLRHRGDEAEIEPGMNLRGRQPLTFEVNPRRAGEGG